MIVGVRGAIGSGKDTVGQIIQYLTSTCSRQDSGVYRTFTEFLEKRSRSNFDIHYHSDWEIKKFAEKLKIITALLIGCKVEDFESQEFKKTNLPPEWDRWVMYNKSDPENILSISDSEESLLHSIGFTKELIEGVRKIDSDFQIIIEKSPITVRRFLQEVGTEAFRDIIHPNTWVNSLFADYKLQHHSVNYGTTEDGGRIPVSNNSIYPNWIITDLRFPNEFKAIEEKDGVTIKVLRDSCTTSNHISETALNNHQFKYTIENNGTIEELIEKVREILKIEKIIV